MHGPFDPACSHCLHFVYCFRPESPLADWGYCSLAWNNVSPHLALLKEIERLAGSNNYPKLYSLAQGIYQETDDGCAAYKPR